MHNLITPPEGLGFGRDGKPSLSTDPKAFRFLKLI